MKHMKMMKPAKMMDTMAGGYGKKKPVTRKSPVTRKTPLKRKGR